jgi:hypothetical protein
MMMRFLIISSAVCFSTNAMAQALPPKVGDKLLVQVKPKAPQGCKFVGTVKGTKLRAGNNQQRRDRDASAIGCASSRCDTVQS